MTNQERIEAKTTVAIKVADYLRTQIAALHSEAGVPWDIILAGCHAEIVAAMTEHLGGPATAEACKRAAARIHDLPSAAAASLAFAAPAGRA
ncbi:hypothetical protein [Rhodobacter ferrooxidans]|uniref:Uncharacterized protein n=1 Tax=Rhodobacter ferrooxidans TaxID=371731 RepID=C8S4V0_9RHOB|nr:hypothetical protein [Rhodobacter sp. SW2]EEW24009.1 hypothetical protein Rsw2DRAFT_3078 [Rhodobacter sp. SW2]